MKELTTPIKTGVIGLGRAGWNIHINRMRNDARFQVTAVSDFETERLTEASGEFGCEGFRDYRELLAKADCELVVVASQSMDHARHAIDILASGRHAIVEKPMALNMQEAAGMIETAEIADRRLFPYQNYRYQPDVRHIQEVIASGLLGRVFEICIRWPRFERRNDWQTLQKYGGGCLNNTCAHFIDVALVLLDSPVRRIFSDLQLTTDVGDADDHCKILLKGENGCLIDLEISTSCAASLPKWLVMGTNGTLVSDGETSEIKYFDPVDLKPLAVKEAPPNGRQYGSDEVLPWRMENRTSRAEAPMDFYDNVFAVLRAGAAQDITPKQVREVIRIIEIAHRENAPL